MFLTKFTRVQEKSGVAHTEKTLDSHVYHSYMLVEKATTKEHFVRPKWGLYRSLKGKDMLKSEIDSIRFADFELIKNPS